MEFITRDSETQSVDAPILDNSSCFFLNQSTVLKGLDFGGVPLVLLLDFCVFIILVVLFSIIREKFWDYGRLALVADCEGFTESSHRRYRRMVSSSSASPDGVGYESGFCSWLPYIVRLDEEKIKERCGMDAVHYLSFQRHLIILLVLLTVLSLAVILPVNMSGNLLRNEPQNFGRTTIANLKTENNLLWLHTGFAVLYLALTVIMLRLHTSQMKGMHKQKVKKSLFVCSVPKTATEEDVTTHFTEAYPTCQVSAVTLAYNVSKVFHLDKERVRAGKNLRYYERVLEQTNKRQRFNPCFCGYLCCCPTCEVDAIDYYSAKEKQLLEEVREQVEEIPKHRLGMGFVTLQTEAMANHILKDFNALRWGESCCGCGREPQPSTKSKELKVKNWQVSFAPHPKSVYWENLSIEGFWWIFRCVMINIFLFILLTFLTTPTIIISTIDKFNVTKPIYYLNSPIISQFFPTLLLWTFSALLPTIVYYSTVGEAHWSRSSEQLSMMRKLYFFLIFMVLILPSLGLTSLAVFFRWLFDKEFLSDGKVRFECVFLPDQGAFFVNYVIAAGLVGSGMDLLRLPGLLLYIIRMILARSAAERKYVKQNQAYEFEYGAMYGWTLCVFTVIMAYSIICPIIVPFGLLYMLLKHMVDRHNLFFAYLPTRLDWEVHMAAVTQTLAAPIICLIWLYFFSVLRAGFWTATSLFTLAVLCITVFICISFTCFGYFRYLSPLHYNVEEPDDSATEQVEENPEVYLPRVLDPKSPASATQGYKHQLFYGSTDDTLMHRSDAAEGQSFDV